jgi:cytochrome c
MAPASPTSTTLQKFPAFLTARTYITDADQLLARNDVASLTEDGMNTRWIGVSLGVLMSAAPGLIAQERASLPPAELAKQAGCFECHSVDNKVVGPAYADVAARYKGDEKARERLIETVSKGGKGNWTAITHGVPMPPHSPRLNDEEISRLVTWILGLESGKQ